MADSEADRALQDDLDDDDSGQSAALARFRGLGDEASHLVPEPHSLAETGLGQQLLAELVIKTIYHGGRLTGHDIAQTVKLPFIIVQEVLAYLKAEGFVEVVGSQGVSEQAYEYSLSNRGREKAIEAIRRSPYHGPAPVPVDQYISVLTRMQAEQPIINREALALFAQDLVLKDDMVQMIGPAINSGEPIFLYGPTGNGKTSLALALGRSIASMEPVFVPYVVEVGGQLVRVFDPVIHHEVQEERSGVFYLFPGLASKPAFDRRWVQIQRPLVVVGGELTMSKLDPSFEPAEGLYHAPLQMKANGGTLVIDDFGRQPMPPADLLNRWIIPLERHTDNISLATGQTFAVPLQLVVIFATNLEPSDLLDEAYLRRLPYKVPVENPTPDQYRLIFERIAAKKGLEYGDREMDYLFSWYGREGIPLRACHPTALVSHALQICSFEGLPPSLSAPIVDRACALYFAGKRE